MVANRGTVTTVASWLVFVPALALSLIASFLILNAAALWGLGRTIAAGPAFVLVFVYVTSMPVVFGPWVCGRLRHAEDLSLAS
jgi:hypothetical protein